jgi:hypothetical protein
MLPSRSAAPAADGAAKPQLPLTVALGLGVTVLLLAIPLDHDGRLTARGYAFAGLFAHDFILRAADAAALANAIPSDNYFFAGVKTYNYYVLWYLLPATVYNLLGKRAELTGVISVVNLFEVCAFGVMLYFMLASLVRATGPAAGAAFRLGLIFVLLFTFSYSYHWLFFVVAKLPEVATIPPLAHAAALMGPVSTSWFKDFLFQPHCILGLMQFIAATRIAASAGFRARGLWLGTLFGAMLLTDVVTFLVAGSAFGLWYLSRRDEKIRPLELCVAGAVVLAVVAFAFYCGILAVPQYSNKVVFSPYWLAIATLPALLLVALGPLAVFGVLALRHRTGWSAEQRRLLLILLAVSLFFMLFVTEVLEGNVFLRKSLTVLRLPLFILSAAFLYTTWSSLRRVSGITAALVALAALAVPTLLTDLLATSATRDARYTTYVTVDEMNAARWIRGNTPQDAVVQSLIDYVGPYDYSLTVCFGERRAAVGLWLMAHQRYPNTAAITQRVRAIETLFATDDPAERARVVRDLHIGYVLIGPREEARFPGAGARFDADPAHFREVYASGGVKVYQSSPAI